ncbi:unnamed protein product [Cyclocybe aegerita]|uniref:Uncharacterized protein n=1 Tax=Cyclocybe aegerita TaxID=1973307 RepID=A0A8S0WIE6_CYCAE|nr:unnamed protein product [Cyclocybe aegerita]
MLPPSSHCCTSASMETEPLHELSSLSLDGADIPQSQDSTTTTRAPAAVSPAPTPLRTICFSFVLDSGHTVYAVSPFPETYMAAKELAVEHFSWLLKPDVTAKEIYLNCAIQIDGKKEWAFISPPLWTQVVQGIGEELRVRYRKDTTKHYSPPATTVEQTKSRPVVVTFRLGDKISSETHFKYAVHTIPGSKVVSPPVSARPSSQTQTCMDQEAMVVAAAGLRHRMKNKNAGPDDIRLRAVVKNRDDEWVTAHLPGGPSWKETVTGLTQKYRNFEILVTEIQPGHA